MGLSGFAHLHCHTTWSLMDGAIPAEVLPHYAAELGYEAIAMTDHDSLLGAVRFATACRNAGVKPIYGAELTLSSAASDAEPTLSPAESAGMPEEPPQEYRRPTWTQTGTRSVGRCAPRTATEAPRPTQRGSETHVTLIARDARGYANLCRLISDAHLGNERGKPSSTFAKLAERAEGLFVLSGCERSEVAKLAAAGRIPEARKSVV